MVDIFDIDVDIGERFFGCFGVVEFGWNIDGEGCRVVCLGR